MKRPVMPVLCAAGIVFHIPHYVNGGDVSKNWVKQVEPVGVVSPSTLRAELTDLECFRSWQVARIAVFEFIL